MATAAGAGCIEFAAGIVQWSLRIASKKLAGLLVNDCSASGQLGRLGLEAFLQTVRRETGRRQGPLVCCDSLILHLLLHFLYEGGPLPKSPWTYPLEDRPLVGQASPDG